MTDVYELVRTKKAVRNFADRPIPDDLVRKILDAGRMSGSSKNTQPWQFIAVRDRGKLEALSKTGDYAGHLAGAALGVFIVTDRPAERGEFDFGRTTQNMMLVAHGEGIGSVVAAIYRPDDAASILNVPEGYRVAWGISFGYPTADFQPAQMGGRHDLEEIVHWDEW